MNLEQILQFIITHNAIIIEGLIAAILITVLLLALRTFIFSSDGPSEGASSSMIELEATLKKLLEQAGKVPLTIAPENQAGGATVGGDLGSGAQAAQLSEQINTLRKELEGKQKEIEQIKSTASTAAASGLSDEDKSKLEAQIKDLQAKLQEYEIISEDIADLSFYKEQNAKLQKELETRGGAAPAAATTPAAAAPAAAEAAPASAATPKEEPAIVGKAKAAEAATAPAAPIPPTPLAETVPATPPPAAAEPAKVEAAPVPTPTPEPIPEPAAAPAAATAEPTPAAAPAEAEAAPVENVVDDQLMAEFAAAVQKQQSGTTNTATATPVAAPAPTAAAPAKSEESILGEVDIEKMVQEAGGISTDGPDVSAEQALGTTLDADKLLQEASALQGINPEEKKLMGDFENFVKKTEG